MIVAVIDDGVNSDRFPEIGDLAFDLRVGAKWQIIRRYPSDKTAPSHGTTCAAIIKKYASTAEIGSIQVLSDDTKRGEPQKLVAALDWCREQRIPIVHMSVGSRLFRDLPMIRSSIESLLKDGTIIVSALANTMRYSAPACIEGVIGVRTNSILHGDQYYPLEGGIFEMQFAASSLHMLTNCFGEAKETSLCNSFAAPLITAKVHQLLEKNSLLSSQKIVEALGGKIRSLQERLMDTPLLQRKANIPIIAIEGEPESAIVLTSRLLKLFHKKGYACMGFGHQKEEGLNLLPSIVPSESFLAYLSEMLELDTILVASQEVAWADMRLQIGNAKRIRYEEDTIRIPAEASIGILQRVVRYLEHMEDN